MSGERLLGVYHYCNLHHTGQFSREYRVLCRVMKVFTPARSEESVDVLLKPGYEESLRVYEALGGDVAKLESDWAEV